MKGPLFRQLEDRIRAGLQLGEQLEDVLAMYELIVQARRQVEDHGEEDEKVALISMCFFAWPGKTPLYQRQVRPFRLGFRGIAQSSPLQLAFQAALSDPLVRAPAAENLSFRQLSDIFNPDEHGDGPGRGDPIGRPVDPATPAKLEGFAGGPLLPYQTRRKAKFPVTEQSPYVEQ